MNLLEYAAEREIRHAQRAYKLAPHGQKQRYRRRLQRAVNNALRVESINFASTTENERRS